MMSMLFVPGPTGSVGSAIAARLVRAGHEVRGLARGTLGGWFEEAME